MSPIVLVVTFVLLALPVVFMIAAWCGARIFILPATLATVIYLWIWLRFRPSAFVVRDRCLGITWPLKHHEIPRESIASVRLLDRDALREEIGWGVRIGAGGFGGGFGWLWTQRHGIVQMYVSRTDRFVWIERDHDRPWLVTPEQPEVFVRTLAG